MRYLLSILALLYSVSAIAGRVIELGPRTEWVFVSHSNPQRWAKGDSACIGPEKSPMACGTITAVFQRYARLTIDAHAALPAKPEVRKGEDGTFIRLPFEKKSIAIGSLVSARATQTRMPASATNTPIEIVTEAKPELNHYELLHDDIYPLNAATVGLNLIFPIFHFQQALTQNFALGLGVTHMTLPTDNGQFQGPGGVFSLNWYSLAPFTGWSIQLAALVYDLQAQQGTVSEKILGASAMAYLGYRWRWSWGLNFGLAAGAQGFYFTQQSVASVTAPTVLPSFALDIGFSF